MFGFKKQKKEELCAQCDMELGEHIYEWNDKKFCCKTCKRNYRVKGKDEGGKCH